MRQRGYLTIGLGIACAVLTLALLAAANWARTETEKRAEVEGRFAAFKGDTKRLGDEAKAKADKERERQEKESKDAAKRYEGRIAAANARADGLCKRAGVSAGCRDLPPVPDTARPPDDASRDQRLLTVLRHAQDQADKLIELQEWARKITQP